MQVQIVTQRCNSAASCNCAAGVRSGDTVFFVDSCRKKGFVSKRCGQQGEGKYNCHNLMKVSLYTHTLITPGTHIYSRNNGKEFIVSSARSLQLAYTKFASLNECSKY